MREKTRETQRVRSREDVPGVPARPRIDVASAEEAARAYDVKAHNLQKPLNFPWDDAVQQAGDKNIE